MEELRKVVSLNVGKPKGYTHEGRDWESGIFKQAVVGSLFLSRFNFEGDGQADLENHGGPDKAVCVYCAEHYPYWEKELGRTLDHSAFGENLTVQGLTEDKVCIGDTFRIGEAVVQISQPRQPCHKLAKKYDVAGLPAMVQQTGYTGYYFRVLEEGSLQSGDPIILLERSKLGVSVSSANRVMHGDKQNKEGLRRLLDVPELSESWRSTFQKRMDSITGLS